MKPRRKGRAHGAAMIVWMFFANLFDPAKATATEQVMTDRISGHAAQRRAATAAGLPPTA